MKRSSRCHRSDRRQHPTPAITFNLPKRTWVVLGTVLGMVLGVVLGMVLGMVLGTVLGTVLGRGLGRGLGWGLGMVLWGSAHLSTCLAPL